MQHTTNYNLNQWEDGDVVRREDFNADNAAIDAALKSVSDAAAGAARFYVGAYTGSGTSSRLYRLGFQPKAVLVIASNGLITSSASYFGGFAMPNYPVTCNGGTVLSIESEGFTVYFNNSGPYSNAPNVKYYFIVFY